MEYTQITLNDWMEMKQKLKQELLGVKQSFVRIGNVFQILFYLYSTSHGYF